MGLLQHPGSWCKRILTFRAEAIPGSCAGPQTSYFEIDESLPKRVRGHFQGEKTGEKTPLLA